MSFSAGIKQRLDAYLANCLPPAPPSPCRYSVGLTSPSHGRQASLSPLVQQLSDQAIPRITSAMLAVRQIEEMEKDREHDRETLEQMQSQLNALQQTIVTLSLASSSSTTPTSSSTSISSSPLSTTASSSSSIAPLSPSKVVYEDSLSEEPLITIRPRTAEDWAFYYLNREAKLSPGLRLLRGQSAAAIQRFYRSNRLRGRWMELTARMSALARQKNLMASWADKGKQKRAATLIQQAWRRHLMRRKWTVLIAQARNLDPSQIVSTMARQVAAAQEVDYSRGDHLVLDAASPQFVYPFAEYSPGPSDLSGSAEDESMDEASVGGAAGGGCGMRGGTLVALVQQVCTPGVDERFLHEVLVTL